jgi:hypothetical protein
MQSRAWLRRASTSLVSKEVATTSAERGFGKALRLKSAALSGVGRRTLVSFADAGLTDVGPAPTDEQEAP